MLKAKQEFAKIPLKGEIEILDLDFDPIGFSLSPGIKVAPNRDLKSYSRHETIEMRLQLSDFGQITDLLDYEGLGVGVGLSKSLQAEFVRQFSDDESPSKNQLEALNVIKTPPYFYKRPQGGGLKSGELVPLTIEKVPLTAEAATQLKPTDYFRYNITAAFSLGTSLLKELGGTAGLQIVPSISYLAYGDFQVEVYRLNQQKVLVRASSLKSQNYSLRVALGLTNDVIDFGIRLLDRQVNRVIGARIIDVNLFYHQTGRLFAFEYEFDLADPVAREAYDQMMNPKNWRLSSALKVINPSPFTDQDEIAKLLTLSIADIERISEQQAGRPRALQTVRRASISAANFRRQGQSMRLRTRLLDAGLGQQFEDELFALKLGPQPAADFTRYRLNSLAQFENLGGLLLFNRSHRASSKIEALFGTDSSDRIKTLLQVSLTHYRRDKRISKKDLETLQGKIKMLIPIFDQNNDPKIQAMIDTLKFSQRAEVNFELETLISGVGYSLIAELSADQISQMTEDYLTNVIKDQAEGRYLYGDLDLRAEASTESSGDRGFGCGSFQSDCLLASFENQIRHLGSGDGKMARIFSQDGRESVNKRWDLLVAMRHLTLFRAAGAGLIVHLAEQAALLQNIPIDYVVGYKVALRAQKNDQTREIITEKGAAAASLTFKEIKRIRNRGYQRGYDPELVKHLLE